MQKGQNQTRAGCSAAAIALSVAAATFYRCFACSGLSASGGVRALFWRGLPGAVALVALSALASALGQQSGVFRRKGFWARAVQAVFFLWFGAEALCTAAWAQTVCREEFATGALPGVLPLLLVCLAALGVWPAVYNRTARMLWWLVVLAGVAALAGLAGQMRWQNLAADSIWAAEAQDGALWLWPEYFALPLLAAGDLAAQRRAVWLPGWMFGLEVGFAFCAELLFGAGAAGDAQSAYTGFEVLRVWQLGMFSRLDALLLLVWLAAALYRICLLWGAMGQIWQNWQNQSLPENTAKEGGDAQTAS
jgi:hypothetical protein